MKANLSSNNNKSHLYNTKPKGSFDVHSFSGDDLLLTEHILLLMVFEVVAGSLDVQEQCVGSSDVGQIDLGGFSLGGQ